MVADPTVRILDARPSAAYKKGHIPGAAWVDHAAWSHDFAKDQEAQKWSKHLAEVGVSPNTRLHIYDDNLSKDAARIWWILRYWGVKDVRLVNGGWKGWLALGDKPSTDKPVAVHAPTWIFRPTRRGWRRRTNC